MRSNVIDIKARITALAKRHQQAADHFGKRKHCIASEFHRYTADLLMEISAELDGETLTIPEPLAMEKGMI